MKKTLALLLTLCIVLALGACGAGDDPASVETAPGESASSENPEALHVGFSIVSLEFPFYVSMLDGFKAACEEKGWTYEYTDAGLDAETQLNDCADLIMKDVDVLVISSWYGDILSDVFEQAEAADIPVFLIDTQVPESDGYVSSIGTVNYDAGMLGGKWAAQHLAEDGKTEVNLVLMHATDVVATDRANGFVAGLEEAGVTVNLLNTYVGSTREAYMTACEDALTTYDNIDLIFGSDAQAGLGSYDACQGAGRYEVEIMGFDCEDEEVERIDSGTQYIASVMQFPAVMAETTVENLDRYVFGGETIEQSLACDAGIYCAEGEITADEIG